MAKKLSSVKKKEQRIKCSKKKSLKILKLKMTLNTGYHRVGASAVDGNKYYY